MEEGREHDLADVEGGGGGECAASVAAEIWRRMSEFESTPEPTVMMDRLGRVAAGRLQVGQHCARVRPPATLLSSAPSVSSTTMFAAPGSYLPATSWQAAQVVL